MGVVVYRNTPNPFAEMSTTKELIEGLDRAIEMERSAMQIYQSARRRAEADEALRLQQIEESHLAQMQRMESERERIQHDDGEGILGDAIESIGKAFTDLLAGIPVSLIEDATVPTVATLRRLEEELLGFYQRLLLLADPHARVLMETAITAGRGHVAQLEQIDSI
jgi:rubrerythrin